MASIFDVNVDMTGRSYRDNSSAFPTMPSVSGTGLPTDWERLMREANNVVTKNGPSTLTTPADIRGEMVRSYHLKFRGVTFLVMLPYDAGEYFSDLKNITKDELRVFEVVYPDHHAKIKEAWAEAYIKVQAGIIFDKDD